jgi:hypothetical protein
MLERSRPILVARGARPTILPYLAAFVALAALIFGSPPRAGARSDAPPTPGSVQASFEAAAAKWGVPVQILMAVGYVESHWEQRPNRPSIDGGFGIMHLVDGSGKSLERVAALTGLSAASLRDNASANIEGGAALLSDISHKLNNTKTTQIDLTTWYAAVAQSSGADDATVRDGYASQVFDVIREGRSAALSTGETVTLAPSPIGDIKSSGRIAPSSEDYPPALWVPANANNFSSGRQGTAPDTIIIHDTEGSYSSAISWFQNPNSGVSAHYVIRSSDGQITQMVREADTAYHAGNWSYNLRAIGVEHEGYEDQQGWYTEAMYQASSGLVRYMANRWSIKKDRAHIIGHYQVPGTTHTDPGPYWDWTHYMALVRRDDARSALVDNTSSGFAAQPPEIDPQHYWWVYAGGYGGSNTYVTGSVSNPASSYNSGTWTARMPATGYYDLYAFIPWVDNATADTSNARYQVLTADGNQLAQLSQKSITDVGTGSWAYVGRFRFLDTQDAVVTLTDYTGETGRNVWFDALMWIPADVQSPPPTPYPTIPPTAHPSATARPTSTSQPGPTWTPGPCGMRFTDLPDTDWSYSYVSYLYCAGAISGYADGTFQPNAGTTRAQLAKMLALAYQWPLLQPAIPSFYDVPTTSQFYVYIETARDRGIINGYPDGTFRPNNPVTRAQAAKMLVLARGWLPLFPSYPTFTDVQPDAWEYGYVEMAASMGVVGGYVDSTFRPGASVTRAQLCKMLTLCLQQLRPQSPQP